jgi:adenine-specific DNA methylase
MGRVECPRCGRVTEAAGIWLWVAGQGERLRVENGRIVQSGHASVFDLACGCKFDTELWRLSVSTRVSVASGASVDVHVTPVAAIPDRRD